MKSCCFILLICILSLPGISQTYSITGDVFNAEGEPLPFSSVVFLNPGDSTMEFFSITNNKGHFAIKNIKAGKYCMQIAFLGYETFKKEVTFPGEEGSNFGIVVLNPREVKLEEVQVTADHVPFQINKDTIQYNLSAFRIKPNAITEDLLKKLPGIEIDRAGNIKALGEDIDRLLVDGKEFFGNDPKIATRNIPADALDKVQVFDKRSEESEFTGMDDGRREKTLNLVLKEEKKNAFFGNVLAGGGYDEYYQASGKLYKFTDEKQLAVLGMTNNVNQFGFSFSDYLNFNGGIGGIGSGQGMTQILIDDGRFPVNFGQTVSGLMNSGAWGANFSKSNGPKNRMFFSYLGNQTARELIRDTYSQNFTNTDEFIQNEESEQDKEDMANRFNFGIRKRISGNQNFIMDGQVSLTGRNINQKKNSSGSKDDILTNLWRNNSVDQSAKKVFSSNSSYMNKLKAGNTVLKLTGNGILSRESNNVRYNNITEYLQTGNTITNALFQKDLLSAVSYSAGFSVAQRLGKKFYIEPEVQIGRDAEILKRNSGFFDFGDHNIDSLSPELNKEYKWVRSTIRVKRNTEITKLTVMLSNEHSLLSSILWEKQIGKSNFCYFLPAIIYENQYKTARKVNFSYTTNVNAPSVTQLLPLANQLNPLFIYKGNQFLKPEYLHNASLSWWIFDQFSFTTLLSSINASYTRNKISWNYHFDDQLIRYGDLINVDEDLQIGGNINFTTPIRKFGIKINTNIQERWNKGVTYVNEEMNKNINHSQRLFFSADNRKKDKWDLISGIGINLTKATYSVQSSLNTTYYDFSWFGEIRYISSDKWDFEITADITNYSEDSFNDAQIIPLVGAEVNYYLLNNKRGTLTLSAFDLLDKNSIVQRVSELNYLRETRSNTIGRYVMLTFTYRLNKFGGASGGLNVEVNKR